MTMMILRSTARSTARMKNDVKDFNMSMHLFHTLERLGFCDVHWVDWEGAWEITAPGEYK